MPSYNTRDLLVHDDIIAKAKQLAEMICMTDEVIHYQKAEKLVQKHERVQELISSMKKKQKEIVAFESFQNQAMVDKIEQEIDELQQELDNIPLVLEFQQSQTDVNYMLQLVMSVIRDTVAEKIDVEAATLDAPQTCSD
ncbi:RicAFT regulatory complex protein RicA family protein [Paenibacillus popilliae]|uniref:Predicted membrane protein n=1 Tax=Paenibacillus popilliae ATCC 14706 TaxID=1212764 RepID=M9LQL6_PAEPP|nr:YlbF family regulator [Paenibacillus popilliae]GAC43216.1 predicted membrane protein [Paenibacillus popilliae ATCC 14706]